MPRIPPTLVRTAIRINHRLSALLGECRDVESAFREFRWLHEHAVQEAEKRTVVNSVSSRPNIERKILQSYVSRRSRGEPLQYILGTQPFGVLDIQCKPGVLIPRPETETYTETLCDIIRRRIGSGCQHFTVADICTGTGCIALQLLASLQPWALSQGTRLEVRGFDISPIALSLARQNIAYNIGLGGLDASATDENTMAFESLDALALARGSEEHIKNKIFQFYGPSKCLDVIVSNPPYISPEQFRPGGPTTRSVRKFEPELALVPPSEIQFAFAEQADQFYAALIRIATATQAKLLVMEVGDTEQAYRVVELCRHMLQKSEKPYFAEIWRDDGSAIHDADLGGCGDAKTAATATSNNLSHNDIHCRAVVIWFDADWQATEQSHSSPRTVR